MNFKSTFSYCQMIDYFEGNKEIRASDLCD